MTPLSSLRYTIEVQIKGYPSIGAKLCHYVLPLQSMRLHPAQAVNLVDNKMCNLMGYRSR